jgi:hypothetical protein
MYSLYRGICTCVVVALAMSACETPRMGAAHHIIGSTLKPDSDEAIDCQTASSPRELCQNAKRNKDELAWYRDNEWQYNRTDTNAPPKVCVALSGGGIRSAAFAIGIMKGLAETDNASGTKLLDKIDILSGTSGGAYALAWYYMQYLHNDAVTDLFSDDSEARQSLRNHADFMTMPAYATSAFGNVVLLAPINFLLNGLFGTHTNTSWIGEWLYKRAIRKTFHDGGTVTLPRLHELLVENRTHLPYFIITTTSRIDENNFHHEALLRNTVFEFTPLRVGNDGFTYINTDHPGIKDLELARLNTIAGAAPDSSQVISGASQRVLASVFNADYGQYIFNYNDTRHEFRRVITKLAPTPFYFFTESYNRDMRGSDIYLSDGGHQENLAAYPLIRRQCENIIIVDGEYDPNYEFESYFKLKHNVERELRVNMSLMPTRYCPHNPHAAGCVDNDIDAIEDALRSAAESGHTRGEAEQLRVNVSRCCFTSRYPIIAGKIQYIPFVREETEEEKTLLAKTGEVIWRELKLFYIKLALDTQLFEGWDTFSDVQKNRVRKAVGEKAADYYADVRRNTCSVKYFWGKCAFPQFSTIHQSFTPQQFDAYVDLGATMVKNHLNTDWRNLDAK